MLLARKRIESMVKGLMQRCLFGLRVRLYQTGFLALTHISVYKHVTHSLSSLQPLFQVKPS